MRDVHALFDCARRQVVALTARLESREEKRGLHFDLLRDLLIAIFQCPGFSCRQKELVSRMSTIYTTSWHLKQPAAFKEWPFETMNPCYGVDANQRCWVSLIVL